jgi:GNAT superfamily N-acetyltransferase
MDHISVREARPDDADALALVHADVARYYSELSPQHFQFPAARTPAGGDGQAAQRASLRLVAELDGEVVGALAARLLTPGPDSTTSAPGDDESETRLRIDYLATAAALRRKGIGSRLVQAAEEWARDAGATIAETTTYQGSPLAVPFWEDHMGYEERPMTLEKRL